MGKQRGFKPQGIANPIMLARLNRPVQTGPTIRERLDRERPTWEDLKATAQKKEKTTSEYLEQWENSNFQKELEAFRDMKRGDQEKQHLHEVAKHRKRIRSCDSSSSSSSESDSKSSVTSNDERSRRHRSSKEHRSRASSRKKHYSSSPDQNSDKTCRKNKSRKENEKNRGRDYSNDSKSSHQKRKRSSSNDRSKRKKNTCRKNISSPKTFHPHKLSSFMKASEHL